MFQSKMSVGSSMTNFENNHRIICVENNNGQPIYMGFIGKELVKDLMTMRQAFLWLNAEPEAHDTVCPICKKALFKYETVIAAEGQLFCSKECAREWKVKQMREQINKDVEDWLRWNTEEVDTETTGIRETEEYEYE